MTRLETFIADIKQTYNLMKQNLVMIDYMKDLLSQYDKLETVNYEDGMFTINTNVTVTGTLTVDNANSIVDKDGQPLIPVTKYIHNLKVVSKLGGIQISNGHYAHGRGYITIITDSATPITYSDLAQYIKDNKGDGNEVTFSGNFIISDSSSSRTGYLSNALLVGQPTTVEGFLFKQDTNVIVAYDTSTNTFSFAPIITSSHTVSLEDAVNQFVIFDTVTVL